MIVRRGSRHFVPPQDRAVGFDRLAVPGSRSAKRPFRIRPGPWLQGVEAL